MTVDSLAFQALVAGSELIASTMCGCDAKDEAEICEYDAKDEAAERIRWQHEQLEKGRFTLHERHFDLLDKEGNPIDEWDAPFLNLESYALVHAIRDVTGEKQFLEIQDKFKSNVQHIIDRREKELALRNAIKKPVQQEQSPRAGLLAGWALLKVLFIGIALSQGTNGKIGRAACHAGFAFSVISAGCDLAFFSSKYLRTAEKIKNFVGAFGLCTAAFCLVSTCRSA